MPDESSRFGQRAKSLVEQAKQSVGAGETPLATKVGGRAEAVEEALKAFGQGDGEGKRRDDDSRGRDAG